MFLAGPRLALPTRPRDRSLPSHPPQHRYGGVLL